MEDEMSKNDNEIEILECDRVEVHRALKGDGWENSRYVATGDPYYYFLRDIDTKEDAVKRLERVFAEKRIALAELTQERDALKANPPTQIVQEDPEKAALQEELRQVKEMAADRLLAWQDAVARERAALSESSHHKALADSRFSNWQTAHRGWELEKEKRLEAEERWASLRAEMEADLKCARAALKEAREQFKATQQALQQLKDDYADQCGYTTTSHRAGYEAHVQLKAAEHQLEQLKAELGRTNSYYTQALSENWRLKEELEYVKRDHGRTISCYTQALEKDRDEARGLLVNCRNELKQLRDDYALTVKQLEDIVHEASGKV